MPLGNGHRRARSHFTDSPEFLRLVDGDPAADLTRIALEIARDAYPELKQEAYLTRIEALAERVRERCPAGARVKQVLGQINWVLFVEEGYRGNTESYYDPRNSYLNEVIDRKTGIPITLSVLYLALGRRLGLPMAGVNLPAHFVLRAGQGDSTVFVDPFHAGTLLDRKGCEKRVAEQTGQRVALSDAELAPCPCPHVVSRMLRNLKALYVQQHDYTSAIPVLRRLAALNPGEALERRDLGVMCLQTGLPGEATEHLQAYLHLTPQPDDAKLIVPLLRMARSEVAMSN
jgi:regulator of sirC expression with transglutaminase-like and TPR domain